MLTLVAFFRSVTPPSVSEGLGKGWCGGADAGARDPGTRRRGGRAPARVDWHSTHESASRSTGSPGQVAHDVRQAVPVDGAPGEQAAETVRQLRALSTPDGAAALTRAAELLAGGSDAVSALTRLRAEVGTDLAGPAWGIARQRQRARPTFGADADRLLFTGDTLEQAGRPVLADRRAHRLLAGGAASGADPGGAAGTDTPALARARAPGGAGDPDPA